MWRGRLALTPRLVFFLLVLVLFPVVIIIVVKDRFCQGRVAGRGTGAAKDRLILRSVCVVVWASDLVMPVGWNPQHW